MPCRTAIFRSPMAWSLVHGTALRDEAGIGALTLGGYVADIAARFGEAEAAVMVAGETSVRWSYQDLLNRAQYVARALIACGTGKGTRVGIIATNRLEFLSSFFGAALAGCVATTISTFFTAKELAEVLRLSCCSILLVERHVLKKDFGKMLAEIDPAIGEKSDSPLHSSEFPFLRHLAFVDSDESTGAIEGWRSFLSRGKDIAPALVQSAAHVVTPSDPGALFFSSGSTGMAKGIVSSHRAVCLQLWRWQTWYPITTPPRTWSANGFFFSGNFSMALGGTLSSGGTLVLQRWFDAEDALELMQRERVSMALAWPHQWAQLTSAANYGAVDLSTLVYHDKNGPLASHPTVDVDWDEPTHAYGNTETFTLSTVFASGTPKNVSRDSHGRPTAGTTIKIVDPITGDTLPLGERDEIAVKGPTLMMGYLGIPLDETLDEAGFLRTGDGGYLDEAGRLFWQGRINDIIKTGGANVSPLEIDAVLRQCPGVKLTQTVGVPDTLLGEIVVTCIVPYDGITLTETDVRDFAKAQLAAFKVPRPRLVRDRGRIKTTGSAKIIAADVKKLATALLSQSAQTA